MQGTHRILEPRESSGRGRLSSETSAGTLVSVYGEVATVLSQEFCKAD